MKLPWMRQKENPANRAIMVYHPAGQAIWTKASFANLSREGYERCATVFACVKMLATAGSRIDWYMSRLSQGRGAGWKELDEHPGVELLAKPNEYEGGIRFMEKVISYILLNGNNYIWKLQGARTFPPKHLYIMRPDRVKIIGSGDWMNPILRYDYSVGGSKPEPFKTEDMLHITEFAPLDDFYGLSRIQVAAYQIDISNESNKFNKKTLQNDMRIPGIVTGKGIQDKDVLTFKKMFKENYAVGAEYTGEPLVLAGEDIKFQPLTMPAKDMEWLNGQKSTKRDICAIFNIWSGLLGDHENTTFANQKEGRRALYQEGVLPIMDIVREELNNWLVPLYGDRLRLDYDRDSIEALQEEREKKYSYLTPANFLSINDKRRATGYDEVVGGDVILVPISDIPLEAAGETQPGAGEAARRQGFISIKATKASFWTKPERKMALWSAFESRVKTREKSFQQIARKYLDRQWADVKTKLAALGSLAGTKPEDVFDPKAETDLYIKAFKPWYRDHFIRAGNAGMQASKGKLFDDAEFKDDGGFQFTPEQEERLLEMIFNSGTKVNETTIGVIYAELRQAQAANMTVEEFTQEIWKSVAEFDPWRARLWARTETSKIDNFGTDEGIKQIEFVDMKGWLCSKVPNSRPAHITADGQEVGVNDKFLVGGELMAFPGDPDASAAMVCNCLCSEYPVIGPGAGE